MLLGGKLTPTRFPSWCNVFDDNVVVLDGNYLVKANSTRFPSWCIMIDETTL